MTLPDFVVETHEDELDSANERIAVELNRAMEQAKLNLVQLSERMNVSQNTVRSMLQNRLGTGYNVKGLVNLAWALGLRVEFRLVKRD